MILTVKYAIMCQRLGGGGEGGERQRGKARRKILNSETGMTASVLKQDPNI